MGNGLDGRPEGPVMDFATFQELRLDLRADQYPPGNPNDAYDAAVARASERQLEADAAADMMDVALYGQLGPEADEPPADVLRGTITPHLRWAGSSIYPETEWDIWVYTSPAGAAAAPPASLMVFMDGDSYLDPTGDVRVPNVFDNMIHANSLDPIVGVFVTPGRRRSKLVPKEPPAGLLAIGATARTDGGQQRGFEYDSMTDLYSRFIVEEVLPAVTAGLCISDDPRRRAVCGMSSGAICAFNIAWRRPDMFGLVISHCGSFVNLRGGHNFPWVVRNTAPRKPIHKILLQSGRRDLKKPRGDWPLANQTMAAALEFAGYDFQFHFGDGIHSRRHGGCLFPATLQWMLPVLPVAAAAGASKL